MTDVRTVVCLTGRVGPRESLSRALWGASHSHRREKNRTDLASIQPPCDLYSPVVQPTEKASLSADRE